MEATAGEDRRLAHIPALDGLRGLAVAAVLVYHGGFRWADGGFLGVSTFFTLSGFLITGLLLAEGGRSGGVRLGEFYRRRIRRLLPASLAMLLLALMIGAYGVGPAERRGLGGDALATLLQVANWRYVLEDRTYGDLFVAPSLLQHTWSLAIEEQFYLLFPPLVAWAVARRWSARRLLGGVLVLLGASAAMTAWLLGRDAPVDRLYFGTDTRAPELLVGVALAVVVHHRRHLLERRSGPVAAVGAVALALTVVAWTTADQASAVLYRGGLLVYALGSAAVVAACTVPGPVQTVLGARPLRALGVISYGVYLYHWPIFRWLSPERLGTSRPAAFVLATTASIALAVLSATFLERPIRARRTRTRAERPSLLPLAAAGVAGLVVVGAAALPPGTDPIDVEGALAELEDLEDQAGTVTARPGAPVVGVFGDSTATAMGLGLATWARSTGRLAFGPGLTQLGCGIVTTGEVRYGEGTGTLDGRCAPRDDAYREAASALDVAVVQFGPWDVADRSLPGLPGWRTVGDPAYDALLLEEALRLVDLLTAEGATVLWIQPPRIELGTVDGRPPTDPFPTSDPDRMERFRALGEEIARARPGRVRLLDLSGWMEATLPGGELDPDIRPDGVHLSDDGAVLVADRLIGPAVESAAATAPSGAGS